VVYSIICLTLCPSKKKKTKVCPQKSNLGDTNDHVVDVGANSADGSNLLGGSPPHLDFETLGTLGTNVDLEMTEVTLEDSTGASDGNLTRGNLNLDYIMNCYGVRFSK
jgi:hypothetical protein